MSQGQSLLIPAQEDNNNDDYEYYSDSGSYEYYSSSESKPENKKLLGQKSPSKHVDSKVIEVAPKKIKNGGMPSLLVPGEDYDNPTQFSESSHSSWIDEANGFHEKPSQITIPTSSSPLTPPPASPLLSPSAPSSPLAMDFPPPPPPTPFGADALLLPPIPTNEGFRGITPNKSLELLPTPVVPSQKPVETPSSPKAHYTQAEIEDQRLQTFDGFKSELDEFGWEVIPAASNIKFSSEMFESQSKVQPQQNNFEYMASTIDDAMQSNAVQYYSGTQMLKSIPLDSNIPDGYEASAMPNLAAFSNLVVPSAFEDFVLPIRTCQACNKEIIDNYTYLNGYYYHDECVKCFTCGKHLDYNECYTYQGKNMCKDCIIKVSKRVCKVCSNPIFTEDEILTLKSGKQIHKTCLACSRCCKPLTNESYEEIGDKIICKHCQEKVENIICKKCGEKILELNYVFHNQQYFHRDHFRCEVCDQILNGDNYIVHHNKFYCLQHGSPITDSCAFCKRRFNLLDDRLKWHEKIYHSECFICRVCGCHLTPAAARPIHNRPHCSKCYEMRIKMPEKKKHVPSEMDQIRSEVKTEREVINFTRRSSKSVPLEGPPTVIDNKITAPNVDELTVYA
ncbi:LIM domain containing protein [Trichomonas vaginalis G3]|uniref:LIM domain containing protein n=1 Tax=Trichomonas vaginalis (strain ATCC PRA-98 / G3) TaxID=412133 RepID=A2EDY2_TRIV3|nr:uncharacterized protein TVAGG3_0890270 [Trichomonas vaginalis G3]EAY09094.1 LIM domain containing protein [Trichomonas vaginalis G3]KAI5502674.1 zinc ion binding [Trichomonas vaginalis G3]|eukprot:XP_001321317.1 hypothetical protein [Trichomonas vaginalis G3]